MKSALRYYIVRGLYFLAVVSVATITNGINSLLLYSLKNKLKLYWTIEACKNVNNNPEKKLGHPNSREKSYHIL